MQGVSDALEALGTDGVGLPIRFSDCDRLIRTDRAEDRVRC